MGFVCCVKSCGRRNKNAKMHVFPYPDKEAYNEWLKRIARKDLFKMDPIKVKRNYRLCDIHFSLFSRLPQGDTSRSGLKKRALPTLHLPGFREIPSEENSRLFGFPHLLVKGKCVNSETNDSEIEGNMIEHNVNQHSGKERGGFETNIVQNNFQDLVENFQNSLCRICGEKADNMQPIFGSDSHDNTSIAEKINLYLPLKVQKDDALPVVICRNCIEVLNQWHKLHVISLSADAMLREKFSMLIMMDDNKITGL